MVLVGAWAKQAMTSPHSQALHSASLSRQKEVSVIQRWHCGTCFQMLPVCHVKEKCQTTTKVFDAKKLASVQGMQTGPQLSMGLTVFSCLFFFFQTTFSHLVLVVSRPWSLRPSGIPMTSPAAICWISSAEWGETCSTLVSVISGGRTQVSHRSWHSSVAPVTPLTLLVCCPKVMSKNAFLLSSFVHKTSLSSVQTSSTACQ